MKKYLITVVMGLAVTCFLVSCHDEAGVGGSYIEAQTEAFDKTFIDNYGEIAPDHDWGFGTSQLGARTRATNYSNSEGNLWYQNYDVPYALTDNQKAIVRQYFQQKYKPTDEPVYWTNFFVQQVYKGGDNPNTSYGAGEAHYTAYGNPNGTISTTPGDVSTGHFYGSNQMDQLTCAGSGGTGNVHIKDFNYGEYGSGTSHTNIHHAGVYEDGYTPYTEDNYDHDKGWENCVTENNNHLKDFTDDIMLMEGCSTSYFGYQNSRQESHVYNDMFVRVSGNTIMAWARQQGISIPSDGDVSGMMFVGFDYEADLSHGLTDTYQGDSYLVTEVSEGTSGAFQIPNAQDWQQGKYYKAGARDYYYSDWIIRIVDGGGNPGGGGDTTIPKVYTVTQETTSSATYKVTTGKRIKEIGRVMAEDLGSSDYDDVDYNDVVFDARILEDFCRVEITTNSGTEVKTSGTYTINNKSYTAGSTNIRANIKLLAAGGTIPISVAGMNVHSAFGVGKTEMVNTFNSKMTNGRYQTKDPVPLKNAQGSEDFTGYTTINDIPIAAEFMNGVIVIDNSGSVPHKLKVPVTTPWPKERIEMNTAYNNKFGSGKKVISTEEGYVQNKSIKFWDYAVASDVNFLVGFEGEVGDEFDTASEQETKSGGTVYTVNQVNAINSSVPTVESGWTTIWTRNNDGYLYNDGQEHYVSVDDDRLKSVTSGSKIRVYGVRTAGCSVTLLGTTNSTYNDEGGYMEFTVSEINAASLANTGALAIYGQNFTVTNVAIKVEASEPAEPDVPTRKGTVVWGNGSGEGNTILDWSQNPNVDVYLSKAELESLGVTTNSIIRFYGVSLAENWQMKVCHGWTGLDVTGWSADDDNIHAYQNYWGHNSTYGEGYEFTMTVTETIKNLLLADQDGGLRIQGTQFKLKYITVQNPSSSGNGDEIVIINSAVNVDYYQVLANQKDRAVEIFNSITAGTSKIKITLSPTKDNWNYFQMLSNGVFIISQIKGDNGSDYSKYGKGDEFTITVTIDSDKYNALKAAVSNPSYYPGLMILQGADITCTYLSIIP